MNKYLNPVTEQVMNMHKTLINWFKAHPENWKPEIDHYIGVCSNGKLRVFQTFFNSPAECLSGSFRPQVLEEKDMIAMYPQFLDSVQNLPPDTYCYLFTCNGAVNNGTEALVAQSFIKL